MCPSLTFRVQWTILAILRIWYCLKGLFLKSKITNTELCQYHHFEVNAWCIMNRVHNVYKGDAIHFYQYIWG